MNLKLIFIHCDFHKLRSDKPKYGGGVVGIWS